MLTRMSGGVGAGRAVLPATRLYSVILNLLWALREQQTMFAVRAVQDVAEEAGQPWCIKHLAAAMGTGDDLSSGLVTLRSHC